MNNSGVYVRRISSRFVYRVLGKPRFTHYSKHIIVWSVVRAVVVVCHFLTRVIGITRFFRQNTTPAQLKCKWPNIFYWFEMGPGYTNNSNLAVYLPRKNQTRLNILSENDDVLLDMKLVRRRRRKMHIVS